MQELLQQAQNVTAAVMELTSPTVSAAERGAADNFLAEFQKHPAAWKVGDGCRHRRSQAWVLIWPLWFDSLFRCSTF